jgi:hypothetical protein
MNNVDEELFPDEKPTRPAPRVPEWMITFATRVDRLAQLAIERLETAPDDDALAAAVADMKQ